jgi:4-hydroxy-tetrahydrodipicolinate synthase
VKDYSPAYGIVPPLITPFNEDKSIDWPMYDRLIDWHVERGVSGLFVVCGSSEYFTLTEEEALKMASAAVKRANRRIRIVAGSTIYEDVEKNIAMTKRMGETGVDGCFITTPRELPAEDKVMVEYFMKIHDAVDCPVYAYEMPGGTNYKFSAQAFAKIGKGKRFIGIKDTTCDLAKIRAKLEAAKGTIKMLNAHTPTLVDSWNLGATGGINTTGNVCPSLFAKLWSLWNEGDLETCELLLRRIVEIDTMMNAAGYVMSAKIAVSMMGVPMKYVIRREGKPVTQERIDLVKKMVDLVKVSEKEFEVERVAA